MLTPVLLAQVGPTDINLFRQIDNMMQGAFAAFLNPAVANIIGAIQTTALLGGTLYILIVGLSIVLGGESTPFYTFLRTAGKIALVSAFSLSADGYLGGLVEALKGLDSGLVQALHLDLGFFTPAGSVVEQLDQMLSIGFDKFAQCLQQANTQGVFSPGAAISWAIAGLLFGLSTAALAIFGGAIVLLTKFALTILFALGPLFVLGLMFPQTSGFFDKWLGEVLSFILQNVIVSTVLSFAMVLFLSFISRAEIQGDDAISPFIAGMQVLVAAFVMVYFLWKSGPMATGLSGGMGASIVDAAGAAGMSKAIGASGASGAKRAAALPKQALGVAKKAAGGASKVASRLAHFGKSPAMGAASSGATEKSSASPPSSGAAKNAVASNPASAPANAGPSRPASLKERKAMAKLGARALRSKAIGNFATESASKPRPVASAVKPSAVASAQSAPKASVSLEKSKGSSESTRSNKPESNRS